MAVIAISRAGRRSAIRDPTASTANKIRPARCRSRCPIRASKISDAARGALAVPIMPKADVVIVGYGAAAGPIALELAQAGYAVVVLERGPLLTTERDFATGSFDTLRWTVRKEMIPDARAMPLTFRNHG